MVQLFVTQNILLHQHRLLCYLHTLLLIPTLLQLQMMME